MRHASRAIVIRDDHMLLMKRNKFGQEYYALIGGGVDFGETPEQALYREVAEETGLSIANHRLVIEEDAGDMFGMQYIYLCDYVSGEPALAADSIEAKIDAEGKNLYQPLWLPLTEFDDANLLPKELKAVMQGFLKAGFPAEPIKLVIPD